MRGSDTLNRLKVERPVARELQQMRLQLDSISGGNLQATFKLFRKAKELFTETFDSDTNIKDTKFSLTGAIKDYSLSITPEAKRFITSAKVVGRKVKQKGGSAKTEILASINTARSKDGSMTVKFTKIRGPFTISFTISNK